MKLISVAILATAVVSQSFAVQYKWTWDGSGPYSNNAGSIQSTGASYDTATGAYEFEVKFTNAPNGQKPNGFWLATSDGPNPKGMSGQLTLFYFDASTSTPTLTAYGYNGLNNGTSWKDGAMASGNQTPDKIASSRTTSNFINSLSSTTSGGVRTMKFSVNGSLINAYNPINQESTPWEGVSFGNKIGVWFHALQGMSTSYGHDGFLTSFSYSREGYLDLTNQDTEVVPEPATMAVLGAGALALIRRRRAK